MRPGWCADGKDKWVQTFPGIGQITVRLDPESKLYVAPDAPLGHRIGALDAEAAMHEVEFRVRQHRRLSKTSVFVDASDMKTCQEVYSAARGLIRLYLQESYTEEDEDAALQRLAKSVGFTLPPS